jgi:Tfp pilus assembly protein PilF
MMKKIIFIFLIGSIGCATKKVENKAVIESKNSIEESVSESSALTVIPKQLELSKFAKSAMDEFKKGHFDIAEVNINKAIKEQPNKSDYYHNLGLIHLAKNEQREAIQAFRKGLQLNSQDAAIGAQLGAIFTKEKDFTKAEIALEIPVQKGSQDPNILNNYAIALTANKKTDEAEKIYEKILKANPNSRDIMLNYSIFLIDQKQKYKQGLDLLNRLKFVGVQSEARNVIIALENKAKAGLK